MKFDKAVVDQIKQKVDLLELVGRYVRLEKRGDRWWGLSPFKSEKTPSFTVQPDQGFYYCFATQQGGDAIRFLMELEKLSFPEAVEALAEQTGVHLERTSKDPADNMRTALIEMNERTTRTFQYLLTSDRRGANALAYIRKRGLGDEILSEFRIGYAPEEGRWLYRFLRSKSYSPEFLGQTGLFSKTHPELSIFRNRVIFPIIDERGKVRGFGGRALDPEARAKYINSPDTVAYNKKQTLFGLHQAVGAARKRNEIILCEGYIDAIALHIAGATHAVAPLGTAFTDEQARLLKRWVETVVILFDGDSAGRAATLRAATAAERAGFSVRSVRLPAGMDPADMLTDRGPGALFDAIAESRPAIDGIVEDSIAEGDPSDSQGRELILRKVFPYITIASSEVRRDSYLDTLAERLELSSASVRSDFIRWNEGNERASDKPQVYQKRHKLSRDLRLMLAVVEHSDVFDYLRTQITSDDLEDSRARQLFLVLEDRYRRGELATEHVLESIEDVDLRNTVLSALATDEYRGVTRGGIDQGIYTIRLRLLSERARELERRLRSDADSDELAMLLQEKMAVDGEIVALRERVNDGTAE